MLYLEPSRSSTVSHVTTTMALSRSSFLACTSSSLVVNSATTWVNASMWVCIMSTCAIKYSTRWSMSPGGGGDGLGPLLSLVLLALVLPAVLLAYWVLMLLGAAGGAGGIPGAGKLNCGSGGGGAMSSWLSSTGACAHTTFLARVSVLGMLYLCFLQQFWHHSRGSPCLNVIHPPCARAHHDLSFGKATIFMVVKFEHDCKCNPLISQDIPMS